MADLRQRRHRQTRSDIVERAFELFADRGYDTVTMEEIATAAGVSRSTAYRRFATKEMIVLEVARRWIDAFDDSAETVSPDADLLSAIETCCEAVAAHIDDNLDLAMAAYRLLEATPSLQVSGVATPAWSQRMAALVERYGSFDAETNKIIGGAYLGGIDAVMFHWAASANRSSVLEATRRMLVVMRPLLVSSAGARHQRR